MMAMGQTMAAYSGLNFGKGDILRIKKGVKSALLASTVYSIVAAILICSLLKPCLGLFFTGDVDITAMLPWAKTYAYMCCHFLYPVKHNLYFQKYHARLWLRFLAYDRRRFRTAGTSAGCNDCNICGKLSAFLLL